MSSQQQGQVANGGVAPRIHSSQSQQVQQQHHSSGSANANASQQVQEQLKKMIKSIHIFQKWMQEMLMQIRKELELIAFRFFLQFFEEVNRQIKHVQGGLLSSYSENLMNTASSFLSLEIKRNIELLAKILQNLQQNGVIREANEIKLKAIQERYQVIFVSQYTYECALCFLNENANEEKFCLNVVQNYVQKRSGRNSNGGQGSNQALASGDFEFIPGIDKDENQISTDFLTSFEEINLFHKLEVVKKDKVKVNEIHVFHKAYEILDSSSVADAKPKPSLVYSVLEKSLMVNDFLERKHLESDHAHPSILKLRIDDPNEQVCCIEISKGGNVILCGMQDSQIYLFDVAKLSANNADNQEHIIEENIFSNANNEEMKQQTTNNQHYHSIGTSQMKFRTKFIGHEDAITSLSILYNESYFVSSSIDLSIRLWDIRLNVCLNIYKGHLNTIWNVKFANQGFIFGSCSADKTAILWTTNRATISKVLIGHKKDVTQIQFAENLEYAITAGLDNTVKFWEIKSGLCALTLQLTSPVSSMHLSYSGYYFVTGQDNGDVRLWNLHEQTLVKCVHIQSEKNRESIYAISISFDESTICVNTSKALCYYNINQLKAQQGENIYEDFYIGSEKHAQKQEINRFSPVEPKEVYELPKISTEKFLKSFIHMRNFIIAISKQS